MQLLKKQNNKREIQNEEDKITLCHREKGCINYFPLSYFQQGLWFINQLDPNNSSYNIPLAYRLVGTLNKEALKKSLEIIINRHEVLRTTFQEINGEPFQVISPYSKVELNIIDISHITGEDCEKLALESARNEANRLFDLTKGPLIRFLLICKSQTEHIFVVTVHHIIFDGWSTGIFCNELSEIYNALISGREYNLPQLEVQYADYVVWQHKKLNNEVIEKQLTYWRQKLTGNVQVIELSTDRPRPSIKTVRGGALPFELSPALSKEIKILTVRKRCTLFMTLLAAFKTLLYRYTCQDNITVGTPIGNRSQLDCEKLMGLFINTLVLCTKTGDDPSFSDLLERVRNVTLEAYENQDIPFQKLVEELKPERDLSRNVFYQVMFNFSDMSKVCMRLEGLEVSPFELGGSTANVDLQLYVLQEGEVIKGYFEYNKDLFDESTIKRLIEQYKVLLQGVVNDPERHLSELPILPLEEKNKVLYEWNDNDVAYPHINGLHKFFERQVEKTPDSPAVFFENEYCTYQELNERANQLAHYLINIGAKKNTAIGLFLDRSIDMIVGMFGIMKSGAAYVPLDIKYPSDRIAAILKEAGIKILITQDDLLSDVPQMEGLNVICIDREQKKICSFSKENPSVEVSNNDLLYILFTSGTTGKPKGVLVEHRCYINYIQGIIRKLEIDSPLNFAIVSSFAADLGTTNIFIPLFTGGQLHILSYERATDPEKFLDYFRKHKIDAMKLVPSHFEALKTVQNFEDIIPGKRLVFAGEACSWELIEEVRRLNPSCMIQNHYGPTETTVSALAYLVPDELPQHAGSVVPIGRPLPNVKAYVLDKHRQPVPIGVVGELYIGGAGVARGYINEPEMTKQKFIPNPFHPGPSSYMYRTGDLVRYLPDGNIEFLGRIDRQIKIRGYRIDPEEIEHAIKEHSVVRDAVVTVRGNSEKSNKLVAYLVLDKKAEGNLDISEIRRYLKKKLPEYMRPSSFTVLDSIPLNTNGKVDYKSLPEPSEDIIEDDNYVAPRNELEEKIASIWKETLEISRVGIDDNFFDLGGESFKAMSVVRKISPSLSVIDLFKYPTIRELSDYISNKQKEEKREILHELTKHVSKEKKQMNLICIPYGGGSAVAYQPLANEIPENWSLYAVQIPGRDFSRPHEKPESLEKVAEMCISEIKEKVTGPIVLYGQCVGGALAIKLAYMMEEQGMELVGVIEAGNFPSPRLPGKWFELWSKIFPRDRWISNRLYKEILKSIGAPIGGSNNEAEQDFIIRSLRHDSREAEDYYTKMFSTENLKKLKAPITCVVGERDRTTEFYQERYKEWEHFSNCVNLRVIENAGHFFQKHQADILAQIIVDQAEKWKNIRSSEFVEEALEETVDKKKVKTSIFDKANVKPSMKLFLFIALGQIVSMFGTSLTGFALGYWIYKETGSVSYYTLISVCTLLPNILISPIAGAVADRWDRRKIMIISDTFAAMGTLAIALLLWSGRLEIWHIYISTTISSIAGAFQRPAFLAAIAQITPKQYLGQANGIAQMGSASGSMLAPIIGGMLASSINLYGILLIDFISFLFSVVPLLLVAFPNYMFKKREEPFIEEIKGGWNYIIKRKCLIIMIGFFIVTNFFMSLSTVLVTPVVLAFASVETMGIVTSANGFGLIVGSIIMSLWGGTKRRADGMIGYVILSGICLILIGIRPSVVLATIGLFGFGLSIAFIDTHWQILIQSKVGLELQARVFSINEMLAFIMRPLAFFLAGPLSDKVFEPFMAGEGNLATKISMIIGSGEGRGMGLILVLSGIILTIWGIMGFNYRPLRFMEDVLPDAIPDPVILKDKNKIQELADMQLLKTIQNDRKRAKI